MSQGSEVKIPAAGISKTVCRTGLQKRLNANKTEKL